MFSTRLVLLAVAALATARPLGAQPRPVWSADLVTRKAAWTEVVQVGFSPDGRTLLAQTSTPRPIRPDPAPIDIAQDSMLWGFDAKDRKELFRLDAGAYRFPSQQVPLFAFVPGNRVLTSSGIVTLRDYRDGRSVSTRSKWNGEWIGVWAVGERGYFLVARDEGLGMLVRGTLPAGADDPAGWKETSPVRLVQPQPGAADPFVRRPGVVTAAVSPDGSRLVVHEEDSRGDNSALTYYGLKTERGLELAPIARADTPQAGPVSRLRFSPDGRVLASGGMDGKLKLWDAADPGWRWAARATVGGPDFMVTDIAFRPDGKLLAFTSPDRTKANVWLVDVPAGKVIGSFRAGREATAVAFSPDGKSLATGTHEGRLEVWDIEPVLAGRKGDK